MANLSGQAMYLLECGRSRSCSMVALALHLCHRIMALALSKGLIQHSRLGRDDRPLPTKALLHGSRRDVAGWLLRAGGGFRDRLMAPTSGAPPLRCRSPLQPFSDHQQAATGSEGGTNGTAVASQHAAALQAGCFLCEQMLGPEPPQTSLLALCKNAGPWRGRFMMLQHMSQLCFLQAPDSTSLPIRWTSSSTHGRFPSRSHELSCSSIQLLGSPVACTSRQQMEPFNISSCPTGCSYTA